MTFNPPSPFKTLVLAQTHFVTQTPFPKHLGLSLSLPEVLSGAVCLFQPLPFTYQPQFSQALLFTVFNVGKQPSRYQAKLRANGSVTWPTPKATAPSLPCFTITQELGFCAYLRSAENCTTKQPSRVLSSHFSL